MTIIPESTKPVIRDISEYRLPEGRILHKIFDTIPRIIKSTGFNIFNYRQIFDDPATMTLIRKGDSIGCFYIESPGMRSLLARTDCHTFEMLTAVSSIIRPGVAESGMMKEFIDRHKDPTRRKYLLPEMEKYLGETYGVMIYQEDVIKVAHHIVGLTLEEADLLRKAMSGKMRSHKAMEIIHSKFFTCCKDRKYSDEISHQLWKQIESFAGYAFCKAHSASFALLSFQVAYLKAHYPAKFMAAVLTNQGGYYSAAVYVSEAQRLGIKVLLPCVNEGYFDYKANEEKKEIRIGLMAIKNLDTDTIDTIIKERNSNGKYQSLSEFLSRTKISYKQTIILILCGALDCFKQTRPTLMRWTDIYFKHRKVLTENTYDLFPAEITQLEQDVVSTRDFSINEKCLYEYEAFGYMLTQHPLQFFSNEINTTDIIPSSDMLKYHNKRIKMVGWYMASKRIKTKKGELMKFLSLEDMTGTFEAVIFPNAYQKFAELTLSMGPYFVEGKVDALSGNNIIVDTLSVLTSERARSITQKDRTGTDFYGDAEKDANEEEFYIVKSLNKEKLRQAYLG